MHLRFDLLFQHDLAALEDFLNMRTQLARVRIDDREFLFNAESKRVLFRAHGGSASPKTMFIGAEEMSLKNVRMSSRAHGDAGGFHSRWLTMQSRCVTDSLLDEVPRSTRDDTASRSEERRG